MLEKLQSFITSTGQVLSKLGARRLAALGLVGVVLFGTILYSSYYLTRPTYETLYIGLSRDDVNRMGMALGEAGIDFDVSADGSVVRVPVGTAGKARMFLAEKGLPTSTSAGYELFDKMGSLGLTSFMQEITRQRALEGEISRTIQAVRGVKASWVHIVLPDKGSFRRGGTKPTASVVVRTDGGFAMESAASIRQIVAAAVPSLEAGGVTVMDTNGQMLASGADTLNGSPVMMVSLESHVAARMEENIRRQLAPQFGLGHFQTSVRVELDTDRRQIKETTFDPDSAVPRSKREIKETGNSTNSRNSDAVSVEQNIPQEELASGGGDSSSDNREKREDITNYEINSKTVSTVSDGYSVRRLSVSVVVDRASLMPRDAATPLPPNFVEDKLAYVRQTVISATGLDPNRGDVISVTAVDFIASAIGADLDAQPESSGMAFSTYAPSLLNGAIMAGVVLLVLLLGVRPLVREVRNAQTALAGADVPALGAADGAPQLLAQGAAPQVAAGTAGAAGDINDLRNRMHKPPQDRLEQMVELDEERFVGVLRDWVRQPPNAQTQAG
ncbi:MAG: Flagellar M-ring protein FliF [Candidatus Tokpelaia hoelldobleri]|uniref:Flagellar M-ring protein n=1 Tax=Candidatus Tokpelaia hoelldobleri TaxID=1902579 RepID=A0A1U9JSX3_9HYPH|nr:MAG: Flagellar M-ring protein FliF [Candidatus Tokpelaia hoelldoblerii]